MDKAERFKRVVELINELKQASAKGSVIVVEGRKDEKVLRKLGVRGRIVLATRVSILVLSEELSQMNSEIIILTDWDRAGERLAKKLNTHLQSSGVVANTRFHHLLSNLVKKDIKDVEGLDKYLCRLDFEVFGLCDEGLSFLDGAD